MQLLQPGGGGAVQHLLHRKGDRRPGRLGLGLGLAAPRLLDQADVLRVGEGHRARAALRLLTMAEQLQEGGQLQTDPVVAVDQIFLKVEHSGQHKNHHHRQGDGYES